MGYATGINGSLRDYFLKSWRYLWTSKKTLSNISILLKKNEPDVICLIECDTGSIRSHFKSQAQLLAREIGCHFIASQSKYGQQFWGRLLPILKNQHHVVLSKHSGQTKAHYLQSGMKKLVLEFQLNKFSVFMVHLSLLSSKSRQKQLNELGQIIKKCKNDFIIVGDFNIFKGLDEITEFVKKNDLKVIEKKPSFPSFNPKKSLDLVLSSANAVIKNSGLMSALYSDHLPVWIEVDSK